MSGSLVMRRSSVRFRQAAPSEMGSDLGSCVLTPAVILSAVAGGSSSGSSCGFVTVILTPRGLVPFVRRLVPEPARRHHIPRHRPPARARPPTPAPRHRDIGEQDVRADPRSHERRPRTSGARRVLVRTETELALREHRVPRCARAPGTPVCSVPTVRSASFPNTTTSWKIVCARSHSPVTSLRARSSTATRNLAHDCPPCVVASAGSVAIRPTR